MDNDSKQTDDAQASNPTSNEPGHTNEPTNAVSEDGQDDGSPSMEEIAKPVSACSSMSSIASFTASITNRLSMLRNPDAQVKRIQAVATQAFLYVGVFVLTQTPAVVVRVLDSMNVIHPEDEARIFPLLLLEPSFNLGSAVSPFNASRFSPRCTKRIICNRV